MVAVHIVLSVVVTVVLSVVVAAILVRIELARAVIATSCVVVATSRNPAIIVIIIVLAAWRKRWGVLAFVTGPGDVFN